MTRKRSDETSPEKDREDDTPTPESAPKKAGSKAGKPDRGAGREDKLAAALRANLRRRKQTGKQATRADRKDSN